MVSIGPDDPLSIAYTRMRLYDVSQLPVLEQGRIVGEFKKALSETGMKVPMATTNLFSHPIFKDGAFTSNDPSVRAFALQKTMRAMDLGAELGAKTYVFWGGREGSETDACRNPYDAIQRFREALDYLCEYSKDKDYGWKKP